eukprot:TRINITY_DN2985_c0_g1_i2.p1 TRINITY_DN2985_c0_g1~~TRINITY_DN2985_c0_g1_i2.p1  ORF type:complete len:162 (-),score=46.23 TRINITY_DN2985_c0_g1_i2:48-533(-)
MVEQLRSNQQDYAIGEIFFIANNFNGQQSVFLSDIGNYCKNKSILLFEINAIQLQSLNILTDYLNNQNTNKSTTIISKATITAPDWAPDHSAKRCWSCSIEFTFANRKHHCRNCGKIFCRKCTSNRMSLEKFGFSSPVRVCDFCFQRKKDNEKESESIIKI